MAFLAVDIGGTKVALALVTDDGKIIAKRQQPSDPTGAASLVEDITAFAAEYPFKAVGVCVPAVLENDTDRILWTPNLAGWQDVPLRDLLQDSLGCPTFIEYDGHAAVLGEWWQGAGKGYRSVASVIIGTGIGGGFVMDGRLWRGRDRLAGAVGWFPLNGPDGPDHWENLASGPAIAHHAKTLILAGQATTMPAAPTAKDVFDAARSGDALAVRVVNEAAVLIGQGVANVISLANPEIVVLGGSVGQQGDLLLPIVRAAVQQWAQPISRRDLPIVSSVLGEEAGLLGAAYAASLRLQSGE